MIYKITLAFCLILMASSCAENQDLILFSSDREGSSDIYLMNHKGKIQDRLTENSSEDWAPVWVDQNHISFLSDRNGQAEVYRMNLITKKVEIMDQPVNCVLDDKNYVYSKRGDRLYSCGGDIFLLKKDEVRAQNLTSDLEGQANYMGWINEQEVSFTSNHEGNNEIYKLDLQKGTLTNLSKNQANDERADFSPNGTMVLFSSDRYEKGNQDIVMLDLVTGEFRRMTSTKEIELIARWSSKDDLFYFGGNGSGNWDIYSFHLPNRRISQLTQQTGFDGDPRIY